METVNEYLKNNTKVYSLDYGVGEIVGILKLYDGIEDYIEVRFQSDDSSVKLYSKNLKNDLRLMVNPIQMTGILKSLNAKIVNSESLKINDPYHKIDEDMDLDLLVCIIAPLIVKDDLDVLEKELLSKCLISLTLEVEHVFKINNLRAREIVTDYLSAS